jgi:hypothetical protein
VDGEDLGVGGAAGGDERVRVIEQAEPADQL